MRLTAIVTGAAATAALLVASEVRAGTGVGFAIVIGHDEHRYGGGSSAWRSGHDRGYEDGRRQGDRDGERGKDFDYWHDKRYRRADHGYRPHCGPIDVYQAGYRQGYERGYRQAYAGSQRHCRRDHDHDRHDHRGRDDWRGSSGWQRPDWR
jgi:hypothetical protein